MKANIILITLFALLIVYAALAQNPPGAAPVAPPPTAMDATPTASATTAPAQAGAPPSVVAAMAAAQSATTAQTGSSQSAGVVPPPASTAGAPAAATDDTPPAPKNEIRMNFQGTSLTDVLNYLSSAAGFVIVQETPVSGTVNIISKQPVTADEAVELLNTVLVSKGYVAMRNGRILKIVSRTGVQTRSDMPVDVGNDPSQIPKVDDIVTQIIPVRYVDATKLIDNLRPLLGGDATISVNEGSNAILLTDTQANIHRMAEIVKALDTSVSSISTIKVYPLRYADAKDFANVLTQLFNPEQSNNTAAGQGGPAAFFARMAGRGGGGGGGFGGGGGDDGSAAASSSEARKAATRVVAVADDQSNSVVVSAPDEYITTIDEIVARLDTSTTDVTQTRIFQLEHADSGEVSTILNSLYGDALTVSGNGTNNNNNRNNNNGQNRGPFAPQQQSTATPTSERALQQARMVAVPDPRTNSILVNCSADTMIQVAQTIGRLDATDAKKQHVYVHVLQHADPDSVVAILRTLFGDTVSSSGTASVLQQRTTTGASSDVTSTLNTNSTSGSR